MNRLSIAYLLIIWYEHLTPHDSKWLVYINMVIKKFTKLINISNQGKADWKHCSVKISILGTILSSLKQPDNINTPLVIKNEHKMPWSAHINNKWVSELMLTLDWDLKHTCFTFSWIKWYIMPIINLHQVCYSFWYQYWICIQKS